MHVKVCNGMWPFVSDVGLSEDGKISFYRTQMNHNGISSDLANKITNNFLGNPISADLTDKVYSKDVGSDMVCLLTYNTKVSVNTMLKFFTICGKKI